MTWLVDTSALYAVIDRDDANHRRARSIWGRLLSQDQELVSSNYIVVEAAALVQRRLGTGACRTLFDAILPALTIERITPEDHYAASAALLAAARRQLSLVDCCTFVVMRRLGLTHAFAFDRHFVEQSFTLAR
jgi:predicted nucleic acid-binding protein